MSSIEEDKRDRVRSPVSPLTHTHSLSVPLSRRPFHLIVDGCPSATGLQVSGRRRASFEKT